MDRGVDQSQFEAKMNLVTLVWTTIAYDAKKEEIARILAERETEN